MNTDHELQRQITSVFANEAPSGYPEELLSRVLTTTSRTRPRPTWLADIKEPPMRIPARVVVGSPTLRLAAILALTLALALALAGAVAGAASLLPGPPLPEPYGPARNGSMIYEHAGDIYLADADGSNSRAIITGDTNDWSPWFSHDGRTFVFARGDRPDFALMVADADGSKVRQVLKATEWNAEFMPQDTEMVATRTVDGQRVLSMIDIAVGSVRNLDLGGLEPDYWQMPRPPDGQEIIFKAYSTTQGGSQLGLYAVRPDGSGLRTIGEPSTTSDPDLSFQEPVLSPDGSTIAFWNWEPKEAGATSSSNYLHVRDLSSGDELPIPLADDHVGLLPHYSPDSTMMVYEADIGGSQQLRYGPVDGSVEPRSIGPKYSYLNRNGFDFTPDGQQVILSLSGNKTLSIGVASGEATELKDIPTLPYWQRLAP